MPARRLSSRVHKQPLLPSPILPRSSRFGHRLATACAPPALSLRAAQLRHAIEADRFGIAAHVLAVSRGCTADRCSALALLHDESRVRANLAERPFDTLVKRYAASWSASERSPEAIDPPRAVTATPRRAVKVGQHPILSFVSLYFRRSISSPQSPLPRRPMKRLPQERQQRYCASQRRGGRRRVSRKGPRGLAIRQRNKAHPEKISAIDHRGLRNLRAAAAPGRLLKCTGDARGPDHGRVGGFPWVERRLLRFGIRSGLVRNRVNTAVLVAEAVEREAVAGTHFACRIDVWGPRRNTVEHTAGDPSPEPEPRPTKQGRYSGVQTTSDPHRAVPSEKGQRSR